MIHGEDAAAQARQELWARNCEDAGRQARQDVTPAVSQSPEPDRPRANRTQAFSSTPALGERVVTKGRPGTVRYIGALDGTKGTWFGLELDNADGKHNGTLKGRSYFECAALHGLFVRSCEGTSECPVCFDACFETETLSCGHRLCSKCLSNIRQTPTLAQSCPTCRTSLGDATPATPTRVPRRANRQAAQSDDSGMRQLMIAERERDRQREREAEARGECYYECYDGPQRAAWAANEARESRRSSR